MTDIGGYFASLELVTNASSFDKARKYFSYITVDADKASAAMDRLQEQIEKNASSFFKQSATVAKQPNSYQQMKGFKMNPQSGYMIQDPEDPQKEKSQKKNDYLTRLASLYAMMKLLGMLKDLAVKIANLTYTMTQANMKAYSSAVQANMSPGALKTWTLAANMNNQDATDMLSRFSSFNKAFVDLGLGQGDAFGAIAQDMSLLGRLSGKSLDPKKMIGMNNDERISAVFDALKVAFGKDQQLAINLANRLLGTSLAGILTNDMTTGKNSYARAQGAMLVQPSKQDVAIGQEIGLMKEGLAEMMNLLGQAFGKNFYAEVKRFNEWLAENKDKIRGVFDAIAATVKALFTAIIDVYDFFKGIDDWASQFNKDVSKWLPGFGNPNDPNFLTGWKALFVGDSGTGALPSSGPSRDSTSVPFTGRAGVINMYFTGNTTPAELESALNEALKRAGGLPTK